MIFDFGGVFIDSPFTALSNAANERGLDPDAMLLAIFGDYDQDTDHPWHRLERGEISVSDARTEILDSSIAAGGPPIDPFELLAALGGSSIREDMVAFCRGLRERGLSTGLLTNNAKEFEEFWRPLLPLDELFDDVIDSSEVGLRKPDPRIYALSLERLGVQPSEAVFVDDAPGNVAGAERVGIASVLIGPEPTDVTAAVEALNRLLD